MKLKMALVCITIVAGIGATNGFKVLTRNGITPLAACTGPSGIFLPIEGNCAKYGICNNGKLIEFTCGAENYFDEEVGYCKQDTEYICHPRPVLNCATAATGTSIPVAGECYKYQLCINGKAIPLQCGENQLFAADLGYCVNDVNSICWNVSPPTTSGSTETTTPVAPVTTTEAPVTTTDAPVTTTDAPVTTTEAPVTTTDAPVTTTDAPVTTTDAPVTTTDAPVTTTEAPVTTTDAPVTTTEAPVTTTDAPVTTTDAPVTTTDAPVTTTDALVTTTDAPVTTTDAPVTTTDAPVTTTDAPVTTTEAPVTTTDAPVTTTDAPVTTTDAPVTTTDAPVTTTDAPVTTTEAPVTTTDAPVTTTDAPITTTDAPVTTTDAPITTTTVKTDNVCEGINFGTVPHEDCDKYYMCENGVGTVEICPEGKFFDQTISQCMNDANGVCLGRCANSPTGTRFADASNCQWYFECKSGEEYSESCDSGYYFDGTTLACVQDVDNTCGGDSPAACEGKVDGTIIGHGSCESYYVCSDNEAEVKNCDNGYLFDEQKSECVQDPTFTCFCEQNPAALFASDTCNEYYKCDNGAASVQSCPQGEYFETIESSCVTDENNICTIQ